MILICRRRVLFLLLLTVSTLLLYQLSTSLYDNFYTIRKPSAFLSPNDILNTERRLRLCDLHCDHPPWNIPKTNIQMLELYKEMKFDDNGFWSQRWSIPIDSSNWDENNKLKVFIVPHSHNDPGWLSTVDQYFRGSTKHILNNVLRKLKEDPARKFIWAEISYFSMWWAQLSWKSREEVKEFVRRNQLEFVTGGWVMNDEANSHWISIVHQLTEGHQWLQKNLNYTPRNHWSIDPFGLSPTQAFLLKESGFDNMLIQRVHHSVKKEFARAQSLEFNWKQLWDDTDDTKIFTQLMPFLSYSISYTCGPNPKICYQYDFKYLSTSSEWKIEWLWRTPPQEITDDNVAEKAAMLLDQYRKKSMLFKTNVLLVPLGDDFRYKGVQETDAQFRNYEKLMSFLNSHTDLHVTVQFGTLNDYFEVVRKEKDIKQFPTLTGDFFTYADKGDHYWSGYYTSRPFYKRMERILLSYLRAAEIIVSLVYLHNDYNPQEMTNLLSTARKSLALFQHHDGITGTAKDHVVVDYAQKMFSAIAQLQSVIATSSKLLLSDSRESKSAIDDIWRYYSGQPERYTVSFSSDQDTSVVTIFNSLPVARNEIVSFTVISPYLEVLDWKGEKVKCQISPIFEKQEEPNILYNYELTFTATVLPLGLSRYIIHQVEKKDVPKESTYAQIKVYNHFEELFSPVGYVQTLPPVSKFSVHNSRIVATFNELGLLEEILVNSKRIPVRLDFAKYRTNRFWDKSGAYLFFPKGEANSILPKSTKIKIIEGSLMSSVQVQLPYVHHTVKLYNSPGADGLGLEIENLVNIKETNDFELVMRLESPIQSSGDFFTDLNGYQIIRRKRFSKLPLQGNYYPVPSAMYIEDDSLRLSLVTGSPLGGSSLKDGQIEIMQDRRLSSDDHLGLGQGVHDNVLTRHIFRIIIEQRINECKSAIDNHPSGFLSLAAHVTSQSLLNPLIKIVYTSSENVQRQVSPLKYADDFGADCSLPILRPGVNVENEDYVGVTLHRQHVDMSFTSDDISRRFPVRNGTVNLNRLLSPFGEGKLITSSLTYMFLEKGQVFSVAENVLLQPMDIKTFLFKK